MKKFEFKEVPIIDEQWNQTSGSFDRINLGMFRYREILRAVITGQMGISQLSLDDVSKGVALNLKLKEALAKGIKWIHLDGEDYEFIMERLKTFSWGRADQAVLDFVDYLKKLPDEPKPQ